MSDLDFDELDKAVNTLMGDVPKVEPSKADEVKTLHISSTLTDESRPSFAKLDSELSRVNNVPSSVADKPAVAPSAPAPSLATRRGGRFMDVVHPSSDMKGAVKPVALTSRQGVTIEPASPVAAEPKVDAPTDTAKAIDMTVADNESTTLNPATPASDTRDDSHNDWPDPLDMTAFAVEPETSNVAAVVSASAPAVTLAIDDLEDETDAQPLVSPFLPDAKVEKRPLGGSPSEEVKKNENDDTRGEEPGHAPALGVVAADDAAVEDATEQLPAEPTTVEQPLPPELQSDLMAIETDGGTSADVAKAPAEAKVPIAEDVKESTQTQPAAPTIEKKPLGEAVSASAVAAPAMTGPTSITQQYHEEPTTSDQTNGAIYDTDSYHQPIAHPAKTHSGWLWIIWILLLLMIGGGGAVALYFLGII